MPRKRKPASDKKKDLQGRRIKQTPVVEILKNARTSIDFGWLVTPTPKELANSWWGAPEFVDNTAKWQEMINEKLSDCHTNDLLDDILEHGMLSPVEWDGKEIGNGHHRLMLAILLGWETVPTTKGSEWSDTWGRGEIDTYDYEHDHNPNARSLTSDFRLV